MNAPTFEQAQYHIRWMTVHYFLLKKERKVLLVLYIPTVYVTFVYFCAIVSGHSFLDWCHVNAVAVGSFHVVKCLMLCMCFIFFWRDLRVRAGSFSSWWYISSLLHVWNFFCQHKSVGEINLGKFKWCLTSPNLLKCPSAISFNNSHDSGEKKSQNWTAASETFVPIKITINLKSYSDLM